MNNKKTPAAWMLWAASMAAASSAWALSATPIPGTMVTDGLIYAVATTPTTTYIGGSFSYVSSVTGNGVIFDKNTGALDTGTFPLINGNVYTVVADGSGGWYIGGAF